MKIIYLILFIIIGCASKTKVKPQPEAVTPPVDGTYEVIECYPGPLR